MSLIKIGGIEKFSIVDFPNQMAAVVFMQGCPWRCPFCHNAHLQDVNVDTDIAWHKFIDFLKQRKGILDAVVFSGGEPLVQQGLKDAIVEVRDLGYRIGLHTGGYLPQHLRSVLPLVDWVGFDIKAPLNEIRYKEITGGIADIDKVKESLKLLCDSEKTFECRTTCDPRFLSVADIYEIAEELKSMGVKEYYLQKYRPIPSDTDTSEGQCLSLIEDDALNAYLRDSFEIFDVRK